MKAKEKQFIIDNAELMSEWYWKKNNESNLFPDKLTCGVSRVRAWWKCTRCGYVWDATPNNRSRGTGCPLCASRIIVAGKNDLLTKHPEMAKRWHPENSLKMNEVAPHSNQKVLWICEKDEQHIFSARIDHVVSGRIKCPVCAGQVIIEGINDLATTNPELIKEWDTQMNKGVNPQQFTRGSRKKITWKCEKGHTWKAAISSRAIQKTGCPTCARELRVSFGESAIAYYLSQYFTVKRNECFSWLKGKELDIYLPDLSLGIEYDGAHWHKDSVRDAKKDALCQEEGIVLIRIREPDCPLYPTPATLYVLNKRNEMSSLNDAIIFVLKYINEKFSLNFEIDVNVDRDNIEILNLQVSNKKVGAICDEVLITEWHYEKNAPLTPSQFKKGSKRKVWWKCSLGHEWQAAIYSRTGKEKCGCPYCAGQRVQEGKNDLHTLFPELAREWDYVKNGGVLPSQIRPQVNGKYWWICSRCQYSWLATPAHRVNGRGCPKCGREKTRQAKMKKVANLDTKQEYASAVDAEKALGINASAIRNCCTGKTKTAGGYRWQYIDK